MSETSVSAIEIGKVVVIVEESGQWAQSLVVTGGTGEWDCWLDTYLPYRPEGLRKTPS